MSTLLHGTFVAKAHNFPGMDKTTALHHLPELYARALLLHEEGLDEEAIADRLGIPVEAVQPCLRVGQLKLASVLVTDQEPTEQNQNQEPPLVLDPLERGGN